MTAEISPLFGGALPDTGTPSEDVIAELRGLLERAERGEILGFGYFTVAGNRNVGTGWASGGAERHLMVTDVAQLNHRVIAASFD